jgi:cobyrinic acid a,c-diamide synthase
MLPGFQATPMSPRGLVIAAPASHSGKTLVTAGLVRALARNGRSVAAFKTGPDYIDPGFLSVAAGRPAFNLDPWAMRGATIAGLLAALAGDADLVIGEGVMGLFDGAADGSGSTADLAQALGLPVALVVDVRGMSGSVAALVEGFARFRPGLVLAGVILNRVASERHLAMLERALVAGSPVPVLGAVPGDPSLVLPERHLGLVQAGEVQGLAGLLDRCADRLEAGVELRAVIDAMRPVRMAPSGAGPIGLPPPGQRIAVAQDDAFGFLYPGQLAAWRRAGCEILPFAPLADAAPDAAADVVILPGGYPELHAARIAAGGRFLAGLRAAAARGAAVYGECGGYMVLGRALVDLDGRRHAMAGLLDVVTSLVPAERALGYRRVTPRATTAMAPAGRVLRGHEFHYAREIERHGEAWLRVEDAAGHDLGTAGASRGRVAGSFVHLVDVDAPATPAAANVAIPT